MIALCAIGLLGMTSCTSGAGGSGEASASGGAPPASTVPLNEIEGSPNGLFGKTFTVTSFAGRGGELIEPVTVEFTKDTWGASTPCNSHGGSARYTATQIATSGNASTAKGCSEELNIQDRDLAKLFIPNPEWELNGATLSLRANGQVLTATRQ